jgi:hypothetical protein
MVHNPLNFVAGASHERLNRQAAPAIVRDDELASRSRASPNQLDCERRSPWLRALAAALHALRKDPDRR